MAVGGQIKVDALAEVKSVDITGITKGRGFRRRHQATQILRPAGHARREESAIAHWAAPAPAPFPSRVVKGKRMPGQFGNVTQTVRNQKLVKVDAENNLLLVCGAVPGPNGGYVDHPRNEHGEDNKLH